MGLTSVLGRLLLASVFFFACVDSFQRTGPTVDSFVSKYEAFYKTYQLDLPVQLTPASIKAIGKEIVYAVAAVELIGALLLVFNFSIAGVLLVPFLVFTFIIIHNPWVFNSTTEEQFFELGQALKNLTILGGVLLIGSKTNQAVTHQKKVAQPAKPAQPQQANRGKGKGK